MAAERSYQSPLREAQAAVTHERILSAAREYLERHPIESLSLRRVAVLAGVSAPTVYAHFPTMDDLVMAFFQWLKPRVGFDKPLPPLAELPSMPGRLFPFYDEHGALLRNLMNQPSWDRRRYAERDTRFASWVASIGREFPGLKPGQLKRGALAIASNWSPTHWRWLRDTCGLSADEARRSASWSIRSLIHALKTDPPSV